MKVGTIEQYKIMKVLEQIFILDKVTITKVDYRTIMITDRFDANIVFRYINGAVVVVEDDSVMITED